MMEVNIIGTGNVAWHLAKAFASQNEAKVMQVAGRSPESLEAFNAFAQETTSFDKLAPADVNIIAVSDDAILKVVHQLPLKDTLVVHTSGFTPMLSYKKHRNGVFYALQSFSKEDLEIDFSNIPILVEAQEEKDVKTLQTLGQAISKKVEIVSTEQRKQLHIAAVFANNFTNHLYRIAQELCEENAVSFELLYPLISITAQKAISNGPEQSQTGPAKRGDKQVIEDHLKILKKKDHQKIYETLTEALKKTYGKEL